MEIEIIWINFDADCNGKWKIMWETMGTFRNLSKKDFGKQILDIFLKKKKNLIKI
jgi:hypothetical protein